VTTELRLYVVPNGRGGSAVSCPECRGHVFPSEDYVIRCDVGLRHVYACESVTRGWLVGRRVCNLNERVGLVVHIRRLRGVLTGRDRKVLEGFLNLIGLARG